VVHLIRPRQLAMKFEPHKHIGKYHIVREIGSGATSRVYLARDPFAERNVAVKVFLFQEQADPATERMAHKAFLAESSLAGKLNHPHIVDIYDAVIEPDYSYLVMEYVPGTTLQSHSDVTNLLPSKKVVEIVFKCVRALEYAFQHGVIHRDIKPGNILLSESGQTKVADFGASFQRHRGMETTQINGVGSPSYMSPEQIRSENLTQQTDIYSLGVVMYRLLTGRLPFEASSPAGLTYAILNIEPRRPATLRPEVPAVLEDIVMRAIERDLAERYGSWLDFGKDLSRSFANLRLTGESVSDSEKFHQLRDLRFFEDFSDVALWEVLRIASWKAVEAGTIIVREDQPGDGFYLLIDGEASVTLQGDSLSILKPGDCFGEILYFTGHTDPRTTTIAAKTRITAVEIKAQALRAATDTVQTAFNKAFIRVLVDRLKQSDLRQAKR
jgi:serine/threonine protein kinase